MPDARRVARLIPAGGLTLDRRRRRARNLGHVGLHTNVIAVSYEDLRDRRNRGNRASAPDEYGGSSHSYAFVRA